MQRPQVGEDTGVVGGVGVVVDDGLPVLLAQLPGAGGGEKPGVEGEELSVGGFDVGLAAGGRQLGANQLSMECPAGRCERPSRHPALAMASEVLCAELVEEVLDNDGIERARVDDGPDIGEALQPDADDDDESGIRRVRHRDETSAADPGRFRMRRQPPRGPW